MSFDDSHAGISTEIVSSELTINPEKYIEIADRKNTIKISLWTDKIYIDKEKDYFILQDIINYIYTFWRPNQDDSYIHCEIDSETYNNLLPWFRDYEDVKVNIGCYVSVRPFGGPTEPSFMDESKFNNLESVREFLFIYDSIDKTKITAQQLAM
jgi:hypothetical protein